MSLEADRRFYTKGYEIAFQSTFLKQFIIVLITLLVFYEVFLIFLTLVLVESSDDLYGFTLIVFLPVSVLLVLLYRINHIVSTSVYMNKDYIYHLMSFIIFMGANFYAFFLVIIVGFVYIFTYLVNFLRKKPEIRFF